MTAYGPWIVDGLNSVLSGVTVKALLVNDAYVPDPDASTVPTGSQISGGGYTAGGIDVTSLVTIAYDSSANQVKLSLSTPVDFGALTVSGIGGIVFYIVGGKPLVVDMFGSTDADGSTAFVYAPASAGLMVMQL